MDQLDRSAKKLIEVPSVRYTLRIKHKKLDRNSLLWRQKKEPCGSFLLSYKHLKLQDGIAECPEHTV